MTEKIERVLGDGAVCSGDDDCGVCDTPEAKKTAKAAKKAAAADAPKEEEK